jgi:hypothetical protein
MFLGFKYLVCDLSQIDIKTFLRTNEIKKNPFANTQYYQVPKYMKYNTQGLYPWEIQFVQ